MTDILQHLDDCVIHVSAIPYQVSKSKLKEAESDYQRLMEQSQKTISIPGHSLLSPDAQLSRTQVDARASRLATRALQDLKRLSNQYLCKTEVACACWGTDQNQTEASIHRLMDVLAGMLAPATKERDFRVITKKGRSELDRIARGLPSSEATVLALDEAAVYFTFPRSDIGLRVSKRSSFSSGSALVAPIAYHAESKREQPILVEQHSTSTLARQTAIWKYPADGNILLGYPLTASGEKILDRPKVMLAKFLESHMLMIGNTRSGKTTTGLSIAAQAMRNGVHSTSTCRTQGLRVGQSFGFGP